MLKPLRRWICRLGGASLIGIASIVTAGAPPAAAQQQQQPPQPSPEHDTYGTDHGTCDRSALSQVLSTSRGNLLGSAAGAAAGGLLGSQLGKGGGNTVATIAGILGGALAGGYIGRQMDPADQGCISRTLENTPTNQTVSWRNPDNDAQYRVTPTRTFDSRDGQPCREYVTEADIGGKREHETRTACRQPDGTWAMQNAATAAAPTTAAAPPPAAPPPGGSAERSEQAGAEREQPPPGGYAGIGSQVAAARAAGGAGAAGEEDYSRRSDQELRQQLSTVEDQQRQLDRERRAIEDELGRRGEGSGSDRR